MSNENIAVEVKHVYKSFRLPHEKTTSIKSGVLNLVRKKGRNFDDQVALSDISFTVKEGDFFGIVGRNGSGKSTLLKTLAGIYQPTKGQVSHSGKLVPFIELGVGFNPELTGRENVFLNGAILGFSQRQVADMYDDIVDFAELRPFMDQKLKNYSSGMEVRLAFSMAVRAEADILLIDEVLAVGDADFQRKCYKYFNELKKNKKTVIFVSHDMDAVREYCNKAILIDKQKMIKQGLANEVAAEYLKIMNPGETTTEEAAGNDGTHWGDGVCKITDATCKVLADSIKMSYTVTFNQDCKDPVYGYRLRNEKGDEVAGTNNIIQDIATSSAAKGQQVHVEWDIENVFGDGIYLADVAVVYDGTHTVADWWDNATSFEITRPRRLHHMVVPKTRCIIDEVKND